MSEYNPRTKTWRSMPSLQTERSYGHSVCSLDKMIFVLGGRNTSCEVLDLGDDDPHWRYIASMNDDHSGGAAVVMGRKIYVLGGYGTTAVEEYDVDQGNLIEYLFIIFDIYIS